MNDMPYITKHLLIINLLMFMATFVAKSYGIDLASYLGLHFFLAEDFNVAQLFTYIFMHGGFGHLFFNMLAVFIFGNILEALWGPRRFLFYYLACGVGAGVIQELTQYIYYATILSSYDSVQTGFSVIPMEEYLNLMNTVGASGAIYGILLAFGMIFPNQRMYIFPLPIPIPAKYFVTGYALIELYSGLVNNPNDNVAHFAHLGGMLIGFLLLIYWRNKRRNEKRRNGYHTD